MPIILESPAVFTLESTSIEDRLDCEYYNPNYLSIAEKLYRLKDSGKCSRVDQLGKVATVTSMLGFERETFEYSEQGVPYLRVHNIEPFHLNLNKIVYIQKNIHERLVRSKTEPNDIVMTITGTIGVASVIPQAYNELNISQEIVRIRIPPESDILPYYLATYLNLKSTKSLMERLASGSTRPRTLIRNARRIPVPIPKSKGIQIFASSRTVEAESLLVKADRLQNEIELMFSSELGLPSKEALSLHESNMIYTIEPDQLEDRLDPTFYHPNFLKIMNALNASKHRIESLGDYADVMQPSTLPRSYTAEKEGYPCLSVQNVKTYGLYLEEMKYITKTVADQATKARVNDLVVTRTGTTSIACPIPSELDNVAISEDLILVRLKKQINPVYLSVFLNSVFGQEQLEHRVYGSVQKHIGLETIRGIKIIGSPDTKEIQEKIARSFLEVQNLRKQALKIISEAKEELERFLFD
jgi:restriction endonuclease S subunit